MPVERCGAALRDAFPHRLRHGGAQPVEGAMRARCRRHRQIHLRTAALFVIEPRGGAKRRVRSWHGGRVLKVGPILCFAAAQSDRRAMR